MARECPFCPKTANLSGEHIWSDWLNALLPGKKQFKISNEKRQVIKTWTSPSLNWKAKVVCKSCNNGWMSKLENQHAKPSLSDLITGKKGIVIDQARANSIALFAFKTAVVLDHLARDREPFFDRIARYEFKNSLTLPEGMNVFLAASALTGHGEANTFYFKSNLDPPRLFEAYVLTYAIERIVIQVAFCKTAECDLHNRAKRRFPRCPRELGAFRGNKRYESFQGIASRAPPHFALGLRPFLSPW